MPCDEKNTKSGKLLIRRNSTDTGSRPIDPCTDYWLSPDIWLEGGIDQTTAKVNVQNTVKVRVKNISANQMNDVNVQVWICDYTLGVSPASALAGHMWPLTGHVGSINPGGSVDINCGTWTPTQADGMINNGHVCMAANCYADTPPDGQSIPPAAGFSFCCDSHHAQRNIGVQAVTGGSSGVGMGFSFKAGNPDLQVGAEYFISVREVLGAEAFGPGERELIASGPYAKLPVSMSEIKAEKFGVTRPGRCGLFCCLFGQRYPKQMKIKLGPGKSMQLVLRAKFNPREPVGSLHTFDVVQMDRNREVIGGARMLAIITP